MSQCNISASVACKFSPAYKVCWESSPDRGPTSVRCNKPGGVRIVSRQTDPRIKPSEITPESVYLRRRELLKGLAFAPALLAGCGNAQDPQPAAAVEPELPGKRLVALRNSAFSTSETLTRATDATHYNNYYEFGTDKADPARNSSRFRPQPWSVTVGGKAAVTGTFTLEDLLKGHALEERIYRLRCVEAWSMVIPWIGIPLAAVLKRFEPSADARYVAFTTVARPTEMPGLGYPVLDWPYREGLRIDEAMHPLTLLAVGLYGHELPAQNGAPLRLVVPWKYGYKSIKSIVRIDFTEEQPPTSWNQSAPDEYGFYSNVNPAVSHPRWSQATERRIAGDGFSLTGNRLQTLPFNGYAEQVASLYAGMDLVRNH
ncbi:MAG: protein-methionine-sulfoxide reductase catalytic subunit MsrP [Xanthomonadales bacterium]|nr:protein-methionine-sulfoxide reductase catalytic subunit MsrP [Xanthomonadales bacterium]